MFQYKTSPIKLVLLWSELGHHLTLISPFVSFMPSEVGLKTTWQYDVKSKTLSPFPPILARILKSLWINLCTKRDEGCGVTRRCRLFVLTNSPTCVRATDQRGRDRMRGGGCCLTWYLCKRAQRNLFLRSLCAPESSKFAKRANMTLTQKDWERETTSWRERGGGCEGGAKPYEGEKTWSSIHYSKLSALTQKKICSKESKNRSLDKS